MKQLFIIVICLISNFVNAQLDSIHFHDNAMESQWGSSTIADKFGCFVKITPPSYPAVLRGVGGYFRNAGAASTIKWKVYTDPNSLSNGGITNVYLSPAPIPNPAAGGNIDQQYYSYADLTSANITIYSGDVYVGAVQTDGFFGIGIDNAPDDSTAPNRQWQWMNVFNTDYWNTLSSQASNGQFGVTAYFTSFAAGLNKIKDESIKVFVNPENNQLYVLLPLIDKNSFVKIFDLNGRQVLNESLSEVQNKIDIRFLETGIYMVLVQSRDNIYTYKIIK